MTARRQPAWTIPCPVCRAAAGDECTSMVSGCELHQGHTARYVAQRQADDPASDGRSPYVPAPRPVLSALMMAKACAAFNRAHPVGSTIRVWPGARGDGPGRLVQVAHPGAYVLGGHTAVVQVTGGHGCIRLDFVAPDPAQSSSAA